MTLVDYLKNAGAVLLDDIGGMPSYELVREPVDGNGERLEVYVTFTPKMDGCWVSYVYGYVKFKHRFYKNSSIASTTPRENGPGMQSRIPPTGRALNCERGV